MRILLTGGAGFIGSHTAVALANAGFEPVLFDNFSNADPDVIGPICELAKQSVPLCHGDIRDAKTVENVLRTYECEAVIHFAGLKAVGESVAKPLDYYDNNVNGTISLLEGMKAAGVKTLIFSSSSTVYGDPDQLPLTEASPLKPATNPYGRTKMMVEEILSDVTKSDDAFCAVCLRYFNPIGAHPSGLIGENPNGIPNNLLPYVARVASGQLASLKVFGNDYPTPDGTGVRDYIHVVDLAEGHVKALQWALGKTGWTAVNLGCGRGYSVLEVIRAFEKASGRAVPFTFAPRRDGDIAENYADATLAKTLFGWEAQLGIDEMCRDAWHFECQRQKD